MSFKQESQGWLSLACLLPGRGVGDALLQQAKALYLPLEPRVERDLPRAQERGGVLLRQNRGAGWRGQMPTTICQGHCAPFHQWLCVLVGEQCPVRVCVGNEAAEVFRTRSQNALHARVGPLSLRWPHAHCLVGTQKTCQGDLCVSWMTNRWI